MNQQELNRTVARKTGETVGTIRHLGFSLQHDSDEADPEASYFDWDEMQTIRVTAIEEPAMACLF